MQRQILRQLHLPPRLDRILNKTIVRNLDSSRDLNSNKLKSQVEEYPMLTTPRSGSTINSKRYFLKAPRLPLLRLLLRETPIAPRKVRDLKAMAPPIITSSKTTTRLGSSKTPMTSPSRIVVQMLTREFPRQVTQVATIIMAVRRLLLMAANTSCIMATANTITAMATKSQPTAWEEVTKEMITVVIIKVAAPAITIITTCQDIIKVIRSPCKQVVVCPATTATA